MVANDETDTAIDTVSGETMTAPCVSVDSRTPAFVTAANGVTVTGHGTRTAILRVRPVTA